MIYKIFITSCLYQFIFPFSIRLSFCFILLSPSNFAFASIINSFEVIFPLKIQPLNNSTLSQLTSPSTNPFTVSLFASIFPKNLPVLPIVTVLLETTSPFISPSTCSLELQLKIPSTFAPLAMMVVSEVDICC